MCLFFNHFCKLDNAAIHRTFEVIKLKAKANFKKRIALLYGASISPEFAVKFSINLIMFKNQAIENLFASVKRKLQYNEFKSYEDTAAIVKKILFATTQKEIESCHKYAIK